MSKSLSIQWFNGESDPAKKTELEKSIRHSTTALQLLKDIAERKTNGNSRAEARLDEYDTPAWSHKQAHRNGYRQAYYEILELLSFLD